jgi:HEAT repeat protein
VAGNALFGLYELQDEKVIPHIIGMAGHLKPLFRSTAAWTMGQTRDPQFLPVLEKLSRDLYASVRKTASKAIERINKREVVENNFEGSTAQNQ